MRIPLRSISLVLFSAATLLFAACGGDDGGGGDAAGGDAAATSTSAMRPAAEEDVTLTAQMTGEEEVPDPGLAGAKGTAEVKIGAEQLCYTLSATMAEAPTAAHIHTGKAGVAGDVLVDLKPNFTKEETGYSAESCVTPDASAISAIKADPPGYYVNIHTAEHPKGALRGQLGAAPG